MSIIDLFESFATDFETCVADDAWERLAKHFAENATYWNVGGPDPRIKGRLEIVSFLKNDVANNDRRFDTRTLEAISKPTVVGNNLSRRWRCTYTLEGVPDLVLEGEAKYEFVSGLISSLEEEITSASIERYAQWIKQYGSRLHAR